MNGRLVEIIVREENKAFAFVTGGTAMNLIHWRYDIEPNDSGTILTESWALMNLAPLMIEHGDEEIQYRAANAREHHGNAERHEGGGRKLISEDQWPLHRRLFSWVTERLDTSVNIAFPAITAALEIDVSQIQWVVVALSLPTQCCYCQRDVLATAPVTVE